ncbi:Sterol-sensing domain and Patched family-containing protein [Aphelenchoides besseyi]|nr:Sterol-sensing domain and Patched family-containing protein [Aphelenchoides besseyi]
MADHNKRVSQRLFTERRRGSILVGQRSLDLMAMNQQGGGDTGPRFVKFVIRQYKRWGYFLADHDWTAIIICCILSLLGLIQVLRTPQQNDITGYTPYGARALDEYANYQDFFSAKGLGVAVYIFVMAKDGGTMLREPYLKETVDLLDDAMVNVTLKNLKGEEKSFDQFCRSFCQVNEPVRQFYNGFHVQNDLAKRHQKLNGRMILRYPITNLFGRSITLQQNFFGLEFYDNSDRDHTEELLKKNGGLGDDNDTVALTHDQLKSHVSNMKSVKMIVMQLRAEHDPTWSNDEVKKYEMAIVKKVEQNYKSDRLRTYVLSQTYVEDEMVRAGISLVPYLTVGFFIMLCCAVLSVLARSIYMHQHSIPKLVLAVAACLLPFMSCATALGLMFTCGIRFTSILNVIPFLVLAIGVDSSFLMIHEMQRVTKHCRDHPSRKTMQVGYRLAELLSEVGPAILISVLTNVFADSVGAFTSSREITLLCVGNLLSMIVAFIFQMTFYAGLFSLVARYEINIERRERTQFEASLRAAKHDRKQHLNRQSSKFHDNTKEYISKSMQAYVSFVANKFVAISTIIIYFIYLGLSIWGITQININLTTQKLFSADSPLIELDKLRVQYQVPHFTMATIFVNNPGNLSDPARLAKLDQFVDDMEHIHGSWGPVGTQYFVRDYRTFVNTFDDLDVDLNDEEEEEEETTAVTTKATKKLKTLSFKADDLEAFIKWPEYSYWAGFLKLNNETHNLEKFFFTTAYHGNEISIWTKRGELLNKWRATVDKYAKDFSPSVFHEDGVFLDLIENMPTDTWQSVAGTLICMAIVCYMFLNSIFTVVIASACVLSICVGILGGLSWWSIDLDPITMAAMVISIGCSVDIPAHVSYHYYQAASRENPDGDNSSQYKLANCLSSVAFPAVQAGTSTILCISSLLFIKLYMSEVFVKTFAVCVVLCNIHGLIFLPAFLIVFDSVFNHFKGRFGSDTTKKPPPPSVGGSNDRRNGHKRNGVVPDQSDRMPDRPSISPNRTPESSPRPSPRPENEARRHTLQPAEPRNMRTRTPEPMNSSLKLPDESGMTTIELTDPPPRVTKRNESEEDVEANGTRKRPPFVKKQSAVESDQPPPV